jgi:hypothetical protein
MLLSDPDVLVHLLPQLTRQDAIRLSVTCNAVHQAFVELQAGTTPLYSPAPRVIICASDSQQLLLMPLSPDGQPYYSPSTQHSYRTRRQTSHKCQLQAIDGRREGCVNHCVLSCSDIKQTLQDSTTSALAHTLRFVSPACCCLVPQARAMANRRGI